MLVRLQKHIADLGICSRRKAEVLIAEGKVQVNGKKVTEMGIKVDPTKDTVDVDYDASTVKKAHRNSPVYIALHKPIDYISSTTSKQGQSIMDLLTKENCIGRDRKNIAIPRVFPVGRLDKDSEGLMLLTNDGTLTNLLTHPSHEHEKEYEVTITEPLSKEAKKVLQKGMSFGEEHVRGIDIKKEIRKGKRFSVIVVLKEGKNRQIRKMFGRLGYDILSLKRTRISKLTLGVLPVGKWRFVRKEHVI